MNKQLLRKRPPLFRRILFHTPWWIPWGIITGITIAGWVWLGQPK